MGWFKVREKLRRSILTHRGEEGVYDLDTLDPLLITVSNLLDEEIEAEGPMHLLRIRVNKLAEELGEVEEQVIAMEQSNPRKRHHNPSDAARLLNEDARHKLADELLDVAYTALLAYFHVTGARPTVNLAVHMARKSYNHFGITQPGVTDETARRG